MADSNGSIITTPTLDSKNMLSRAKVKALVVFSISWSLRLLLQQTTRLQEMENITF